MAHPEEIPKRSSVPERLPSLETSAFELQVKLALVNYSSEHPDVIVNLDMPMANEKTVRDSAMQAWLMGDNPLSARFRAYIDGGHAGDPVPGGSRSELETLLASIKEAPTFH